MMLTNERARSRAAFSEPPDLLTVAEVARLLRWDTTAVRRHLKSGVIPAWAVVPLPHRGTRTIARIKRAWLEEVLVGNFTTATPEVSDPVAP